MNRYTQITGKYLKGQKRRSVLTVIGIILSTALITGIGSIYTSMFDANLRVTIADNGDYYAAVQNVPADKVDRLTRNVETQKGGVARFIGFAAYADNEKAETNTPYKYLEVQEMDPQAMAMLPYRLEEGRMPQAPGEIVLDYWTLKYLQGISLGSRVTLNLGTRTLPDGKVSLDTRKFASNETFKKETEESYTVVGLLKPGYVTSRNFASAITFLDSGNLSADRAYTAYVKLKGTSDIKGRIKKMVSSSGVSTNSSPNGAVIQYNDRVLRLYAQSINQALNDSVMIMIFIVTALVVLATIAVIYNAFNISVVERVSQFGLLRCVGATPNQIRGIIFREAASLGVIGVPIGVLCGTVAMGIVFRIISLVAPNMMVGGYELKLVVSPAIIVASILLSIATIYLSALLPARKAGKISPMEAVRGTGSFRKEKYRVTDKKRFVLALVGAEGWMAWKNLGRNRKRFYVTTFSMVISIILFIVFSSLVGFAYRSGAVGSGDVPSYLIWPYRASESLKLDGADYATIRGTEGVDYALRCGQVSGQALLPKSKLADRVTGLLQGVQADASGNVGLDNSNLLCYGDESIDILLQKLKLGDLDREAFLSGKGVILVNGIALYDKENKRGVLTGMTTLNKGDSISFAVAGEDGKMLEIRQVPILAVADTGLVGAARNENGGINLIGSERLFSEASKERPYPSSLMIMVKPSADRTVIKSYIDREIDPLYNVTDYDEVAKSMTQAWTVLGIFLYGFVAVISLIGCLNIINTISTNIIIRTRELSVLRAIGMFEGGIRRMIAWEGILHSAAAAVFGSVIGTLLSYLLYTGMANVREFGWSVPWMQILIAVFAAALVAIISGFVPLKRINKGVIMEGIRGEE